MIRSHITVYGKPWCDCQTDRRLFNLDPESHPIHVVDAMFDLMRKAKAQGVVVICMNSHPDNESAVKFLNDNGIPAVLTPGPCPTVMEGPDE